METIKLAFHISQKPYLISLPLHSSQKEFNPENDETFDIKLFIHPNFEFQQQILKYGSLVKVTGTKMVGNRNKRRAEKGIWELLALIWKTKIIRIYEVFLWKITYFWK